VKQFDLTGFFPLGVDLVGQRQLGDQKQKRRS